MDVVAAGVIVPKTTVAKPHLRATSTPISPGQVSIVSDSRSESRYCNATAPRTYPRGWAPSLRARLRLSAVIALKADTASKATDGIHDVSKAACHPPASPPPSTSNVVPVT
jgi:hypothetical protein